MIERDFLIIGAGIAGASVCEGIRAYNTTSSVTLVGNESFLPYYRPPLSLEGLSNESFSSDSLLVHPQEWYDTNHVEVRLHSVVTAFNLERKVAVLSSGQAIHFGKACLATGSRAFRPPIGGANLGNVFYLKTLRELLAIRETAPTCENVVVVGNTALACEVSLALQHFNCNVTLLNRDHYFFQNVLDAETGNWLSDYLSRKGIRLMLNENINGFEGKTLLRNIQTKSGTRFPCAMAIVAMGEELNMELVRNTPLSGGTGTPVTETLETEEKGIYAVGDIALFPDKIYGGTRRISNPEIARAQGLLAGGNMTGKRRQKFECVPWTHSQIGELSLDFIGDFSRPPVRFDLIGNREDNHFVIQYYQGPMLVGMLLCNQPAAEVSRLRAEFRPGK